MLRALPGGSEFVAYLDAIGEIDGQHCLIDWKTTTSRYSTAPEGLLSLDPQLICYSWISGIPEVALVVFVRKHAPEIQYLRASISEEQRQEFGRLVETRPALERRPQHTLSPPWEADSCECAVSKIALQRLTLARILDSRRQTNGLGCLLFSSRYSLDHTFLFFNTEKRPAAYALVRQLAKLSVPVPSIPRKTS
jgi:hypothetical protein